MIGSADNNVEIVQKKGLLLLQGFDQWVNTTYQYGGHDSNHSQSGNSSHTVTETYNFTTFASIVDPQMFRFSLNGSAGLQQVMNQGSVSGSSYGSGSKYQYVFSGTLLEQSRFPLALQSSRTLDTVTPPFTPTYTTDTSFNSAELTLLHDILPLKLRYERDTIKISSTNSVSDSTSNSFLVSGTHRIGDISNTSFGINLSDTNTTSTASTVAENNQKSGLLSVNLSNTLLLGAKRNHTLSTAALWKEENPNGIEQQIGTLSGSLLSRFGKALDSQLSYLGNFTRSTSFTGEKQELNSNSFNASIHHHLFQSLDTRMRGLYTQTMILGGREYRYSGLGSLSYRKILPAQSRFSFDISGEHAITDRRIAATQFTFRNEAHTVDQQGDFITLNNENPLVSVDRVISVNLGVATVYVKDIDYTVDTNLGRIQVTPGGGIAPGTLLLITYTVRYDASIKYATDTLTLASSLSLKEGKYTLSGTLTDQTQSLISGQTQNSLRNTRVGQVRFKGVYLPDQSYSLVYEDFYSTQSSYRFTEGLWQYKHQYPQVGLFLQARERYTIYDPVGSSPGNKQLSSSASVSLNRPIAQVMQLSVSLDLTDLRDDKLGRTDLVYFRSNLYARFNKLTFTLSGQSSWRFYGSLLTRDDYVRLDITRYF